MGRQEKVASAMVKLDGEKIVPIRKTSNRGTIVRRVRPDGELVGDELLLVTGARVSGCPGEPDFIQNVYARKIEPVDGKFRICDGTMQYVYDPNLTVVRVATIDHLDPGNREFFEPIEPNKL